MSTISIYYYLICGGFTLSGGSFGRILASQPVAMDTGGTGNVPVEWFPRAPDTGDVIPLAAGDKRRNSDGLFYIEVSSS